VPATVLALTDEVIGWVSMSAIGPQRPRRPSDLVSDVGGSGHAPDFT
jgi:hypothetical protein